MSLRRRLQGILMALLLVTLTAGAGLAQDQESAPPPPNSVPVQQQADPNQGQYDQVQYGQGQYGQPQPEQGQYGQAQGQQAQGPYDQQQQQPAQGEQQQQADPPGRVARVQYMSGEVSMQPGGVNDWVAANTNRPLTTADRVWTDKNSRAELNVGDGFLRMNAETSVTLTNVGDNNVQIELDQGTLEVTVKHLERGEIYEVDTPNYAFTVMKTGVYRFDVYPNQDQSVVTVRSGYGEATGNGPAVRVNSGMQVRFSGGTSLQHVAENAPSRDGFDDWVQVRDKRLDSSISARYVSPGVIGYQDLDANGSWVNTPSYGSVWVPSSVPVGWAPYRYGHWAWIAPWGYTWVDDAPWGFAPFHYGRWVTWNGGWGWAPGPIGYWNPYYAPALVGWIGRPGFGIGIGWGGGGWGFGIGINFGWFPLGWGEAYYPRYCGWGHGGWYRGGGWASNNYVRNVNITNTRITNVNNLTNGYRNGNVANAHYGFRNTPGAVTGAPSSAFTSGAAVNRVGGAVPASALSKGTALSNVSVNPTRQSVLAGSAPQTRGVPPASATNRGVVTSRSGQTAMRPANVEAANQATMARTNANTNSTAAARGGSVNASRTPTTATNMGAANNNAAHNATPNTAANGRINTTPTGAAGSTAARGAAANSTEARMSTPTSMGGHYVPRPPSAGGTPTSSASANYGAANNTAAHNASAMNGAGNNSATTHNVPRPPASNDSFARPNGTPANTSANNQHYGTNGAYGAQTPQASRPAGTQSPQAAHPNGGAQQSAPSHPSASPQQGGSKSNSSHSSGGSASVPRPPSNYAYRSAPAYSASSSYGAARQASSYSGASRSGYSASPSYGASRSYGSSPNYSAQRSYGSSPAYSAQARSYGSSPSYSSRGSYSAPRSYGSAPSYHASSGGSRGGGGGGGGSHASSGGGGGGGHHGR